MPLIHGKKVMPILLSLSLASMNKYLSLPYLARLSTPISKQPVTAQQSSAFFHAYNRKYSILVKDTISSRAKVIPHEPGLITIKNGLSVNEQKKLAELILKRGEHPTHGFWKKDTAKNNILNVTPYRGRMFGSLDTFPSLITDLCERNLALAVKADQSLQPTKPTHAIILYYQTLVETPKKAYIPWHQDNGENDGKGVYPVISFALGDSCDFLIAHSKPKVSATRPLANPENLAHRLLFESGDVLIFGGPCRYIWHSIYTIHPNTAPAFLPFSKARLNVTSRYSPEIIGQEDLFATKSAEELAKTPDNSLYKLSKMK